MSSVFALLAIVLSVINVTNFVLVAENADAITERIEHNNGSLDMGGGNQGGGGPGGNMGNSPDAIGYFTYSEATDTVITINNLPSINNDADTAKSWAVSLLDNAATKGWTNTTYRYRIWSNDTGRFVTVIEQGRELTPSYRILVISCITSAIGLVAVLFIAMFVAKKIVKPIEDSDNKQKRFIADAAVALKTPVSVISIDNQTLVNDYGKEEDANKSIKHQVRKLIALTNDLNSLVNIDGKKAEMEEVNLSNLLKDVAHQFVHAFKDNHKELKMDIDENVMFKSDSGMMRKALSEIIDNSLKYADSAAEIELKKVDERITITFTNDCKGIPNGTLDRVFEPFYRLDYKDHSIYEGAGIGLNIVKDIVLAHKGRIIAKGENDKFILKIEL